MVERTTNKRPAFPGRFSAYPRIHRAPCFRDGGIPLRVPTREVAVASRSCIGKHSRPLPHRRRASTPLRLAREESPGPGRSPDHLEKDAGALLRHHPRRDRPRRARAQGDRLRAPRVVLNDIEHARIRYNYCYNTVNCLTSCFRNSTLSACSGNASSAFSTRSNASWKSPSRNATSAWL